MQPPGLAPPRGGSRRGKAYRFQFPSSVASLAAISSGTKTIILTLVIASGAAILAPVAPSPEWGEGPDEA